MDKFLEAFADLCDEINPILKAVVFVALIIFIIKLIKTLKNVDSTLLKSHNTIDLLDQSIEKVQAPLDTVVKVSNTVDKAHDVTVEAVEKTKDFVVKNAENVKEKVNNLLTSKPDEDKDNREE